MKTLGQICEAVQSGERPDYEELRYAVLAQQALLIFDRMAFMRLAEAERENKPRMLTRSAQWQWEEYFGRTKRAMDKDPKEYVGWNNDPENPEFLKRRQVSIKVFEHCVASSQGAVK